jgi:uncharacterized protein
MMLYALTCLDKPGALQIRLDTRAAHLEYLNGSGKVTLAGPFIEGGQPVGSLVVIEAEGLAEAQAFADADPYAKAGLFASVTIREWRKVIG